jgi:raffinose/stachyose/melibiose transport system permease protein
LTFLQSRTPIPDNLIFFSQKGFGIPFGILVMRGFFRTIPTPIIEAAKLDGASYVRIFFRIALPLATPAVVSLCILDGVSTWNEFILAQIFLRSDELRTLPLGLVAFSTQFSTQYDQLAAAVLISVFPLVLVFLFFQRYPRVTWKSSSHLEYGRKE